MTPQEYNYFLDSRYFDINKVAKSIVNHKLYGSDFSWKEFEFFCAQLARLRGYQITYLDIDNEAKADGGIDVIAENAGGILLIQSKKSEFDQNFSETISVKLVREFYGAISKKQKSTSKTVYGWFITIRKFTIPALDEYGAENDIDLIDYDKLCELIIKTKILEWKPAIEDILSLEKQRKELFEKTERLRNEKGSIESIISELSTKVNILRDYLNSDEYKNQIAWKGVYKNLIWLMLLVIGVMFIYGLNIQAERDAKSKDVTQLNGSIANSNKINENLKKDLSEIKAKSDSLESENAKIKQQPDNYSLETLNTDSENTSNSADSLESLQIENIQIFRDLETAKGAIQDKDKQIELLRKQQSDQSKNLSQIQSESEKITKENSDLKVKANTDNQVQRYNWNGVEYGTLSEFMFKPDGIMSYTYDKSASGFGTYKINQFSISISVQRGFYENGRYITKDVTYNGTISGNTMNLTATTSDGKTWNVVLSNRYK